MRIRKGGKFSAAIASQCEEHQPSQAFICQMNRVPWDVIPFSEEKNPSLGFLPEREICSNEMECPAPSRSAIKRATMEAEEDLVCLGSKNTPNKEKIKEPKDFDLNLPPKNDDEPPAPSFRKARTKRIVFKTRTDGKRWDLSKRRTACDLMGPSISKGIEADRELVTKSAPDGPPPAEAELAKAGEGTISRRARAAKKPIKDDEYYYYCGFGPMWETIRGDGDQGEGNNKGKGVAVQSNDAGGNMPIIYDVSSDSD